MKSNKGPNFFLTAALVLLCLVLISVHFTSGMYARFAVKTAGELETRLAAFQVTADMKPGEEANTYIIQMQNKSETAVACSVEILLKESVPEEYLKSVSLNGQTGTLSNRSVTFENVEFLAPGAAGQELPLEFVFNDSYHALSANAPDFSNQTTASEDMTVPFTVRVTYTQVD